MSSGGSALFTFAVLADTHLNARDGESGSPWLTNRMANDRARWVVRQINADRPAFVIHLGDIVHPIPEQRGFAAAVDRFRAIFAELDAPLHLVAGNHDIGDKPVAWMPAATVRDDFVEAYQKAFGRLFYSFDVGGCHFVIHNSPIVGSGLASDGAQWDWLARDLQAQAGRRIFLMTHYPPFLCSPCEEEHYDNLAPVGRKRLLDLLRRHRVEALFAGHVHNFFYNRYLGTEIYLLPAVSAVRHDFAALLAAAPTPDQEFGRDDRAKLGYFLVDVCARDHVVHFRRSYGATAKQGSGAGPRRWIDTLERPSSRSDGTLDVAVDLRQSWAEPAVVPYSGVVDEFGRKKARNDYLLAALWETGIRRVRVPASDLLEAASRARMADYRAQGIRFQVFCLGGCTEELGRALEESPDLVERLEVVARSQDLGEALSKAHDRCSPLGIPLVASRIRTSADAVAQASSYSHFVRHGFTLSDACELERVLTGGVADSIVLRLEVEDRPAEVISEAMAMLEPLGKTAVFYLSLANASPAQSASDDLLQANRIIEAAFAGHCHRHHCSVMLDCLVDLDRGYFPRHGLLDALHNPRPAARALAALGAVIRELGHPVSGYEAHRNKAGCVLWCSATEGPLAALFPTCTTPVGCLPLARCDVGSLDVLRLVSGDRISLRKVDALSEPALLLPG